MPKMKTHKGLLKRIKITASGKVKHKRSGTSHLMSHERGKTVRHKRRPMIVTKSALRTMSKMLGRPLKGRDEAA